MNTCLLFLLRLCPTLWLGASALFVAVGVREVTFPEFNDTIRDQLVSLRFPLFYGTGAVLLLLGWISVALGRFPPSFSRGRRAAVMTLLTVCVLLLFADYAWVYLPLEALITPPGLPRNESFHYLHRLSTLVNGLNWSLVAAAVTTIHWPAPEPQQFSEDEYA